MAGGSEQPGDIPQFNGQGYAVWAKKFRAHLIIKGCGTAFDDKCEAAVDQKALAYLIKALGDTYIELISEDSSFTAAWKELKKLYEQNSVANYMQLRQKFNSAKQESGEDIVSFIVRVQHLAERLSSAGEKVSEQQVVAVVIEGMLSAYETERIVYQQLDKLPTLAWLREKLITAEQTKPRTKNVEQAFYGNDQRGRVRRDSSRGRDRDSSRGRDRSRGHSNSRSRQDRSNSRQRNFSKRGKECFYCKKKGHFKRECRKLQQDQEQKKQGAGGSEVALVAAEAACAMQSEASDSSQEYYSSSVSADGSAGSGDSAAPAEVSLALISPALLAGIKRSNANLSRDTWVVDSGASRHVTGNSALLCNIREASSGHCITYGNGSMAAVAAIGDVVLYSGGTVRTKVKLRDVLYVPGHSFNLFSLSSAIDAGADVVFSDSRCRIRWQQQELLYAVKQQSLWIIDTQSATPAALLAAPEQRSSSKADAAEWHSRYGHLGYQKLGQLVSKGMVKGLNVSAADFTAAGKQLCDPCQRAKQTRLPFESSSSGPTSKLELVCSDLMGPISPPTVGGKRYVATFRDVFTGYTEIWLLENKSEMASVIPAAISLFENQAGCSIKALRTDNGSEYLSNAVEQLLLSKGIQPQPSMPYTPQQNGAAERLNRTLMEKVRAMLYDAGLSKPYWGEAVVTATMLHNLSPVSGRAVTPYEGMFGKKPDVSFLRPYGCLGYVTERDKRDSKLDPVSLRGMLVGYQGMGAGYRMLLDDGSIKVSRHVVFGSSSPLTAEGSKKTVSFDVPWKDSNSDAASNSDSDSASEMPELVDNPLYGQDSDDEIPDLMEESSDEYSSDDDDDYDQPAAPAAVRRQPAPTADVMATKPAAAAQQSAKTATGVSSGAGKSAAATIAAPAAATAGRTSTITRPGTTAAAVAGRSSGRLAAAGIRPASAAAGTSTRPAAAGTRPAATGSNPRTVAAGTRPAAAVISSTATPASTSAAPHSGQSAAGQPSSSQTAAKTSSSTSAGSRPKREAKLPAWMQDGSNLMLVALEGEPTTFAEATSGEDAELWWESMADEYASLVSNKVLEIVPIPDGVQPLPVKWVYKLKRDGQGNIERYKSRLVAKGFLQQEGIDYNEVFAPVGKYSTFRSLTALVAAQDLHLHQLDIKTAFLQGDLEEEIYIQQPKGFEQHGSNYCCRLRKALYGLKQAPRAWHQRLHSELEQLGYKPSAADPGLYIYHGEDGTVWLLIYVDDILIAAHQLSAVSKAKQQLMAAFEARDLGEANTFLGVNILRDRGSRTIKLVQQRMTQDIISRFGMDSARPLSIPLSSSVKLSKEEGMPLDKKYPYSQLVGSLNYLSVCTRPDIAYAVSKLARHMAKPTTVHWQAAKGVVRYLLSTADYGITYGSNSSNGSISYQQYVGSAAASSSSNLGTGLIGFCDADFAGDLDTRRSTTGYVFMLNGGAVSWQSKLQPTVAASTAESEYMAAAAAVKEGLWLRQLLTDLGTGTAPVKIMADNQSAIKLLRNPISSVRSKHIDVAHHFARERVMRKEVSISYVSTTAQLADIFTKALPRMKLEKCVAGIGVG
jgi:transposase InsO family protein